MIRLGSKFSRALALAVPLAFAGVSAAAAPVTQLGFGIDGSGSVSSSDFSTQINGLSSAFGVLPTDSTVEVTVVQFSSSAQTEVGPTLIDSASTRSSIITQTNNITQTGGGTDPEDAIDKLNSELTGSSNFGDDSIINISTDGGFTVSPAQTAAQNAKDDGIDALTGEAIGTGADQQALADIVFGPNSDPGDGSGQILAEDASPPNPLASGVDPWVVPVSDFDTFGDVIQAKLQASVPGTPVPVPPTVLLLLSGIVAVAASRVLQRRRLSSPSTAVA